jgi:hypothetical protein
MSVLTTETAANAALRAEHDELARRLEIRSSIDDLKRGLLRLFFGLIAMGLTIKLGWDRWGAGAAGLIRKMRGPPILLWLATGAAVVLLALALRALARARRTGLDEDRLFARYQQLRAELGLDR